MYFKPRIFKFLVETKPIQQGALSSNKRGNLYWTNTKKLKPYRELIAEAAKREIARHNIATEEMEDIMQAPTTVIVHFLFKKEGKEPFPEHKVQPDLDKLIRAVLDALTGVLYNDDKQVNSIISGKYYDSKDGVDICVVHDNEGGR